MNLCKTCLIVMLIISLALVLSAPLTAQTKVVVPLMEGPPWPVPKTGLTECYYDDGDTGTCTCGGADCPSGQDGDLKKGEAWPKPRFTDNGNGTVTDNLTGLIWLQSGWCVEFFASDSWGSNDRDWGKAIDACNKLADDYCKLSDSSKAGDWRLPNINELLSLIDWSQSYSVLPSGHPLSVASGYYWSSTTRAIDATVAWSVHFGNGDLDYLDKTNIHRMRCVR